MGGRVRPEQKSQPAESGRLVGVNIVLSAVGEDGFIQSQMVRVEVPYTVPGMTPPQQTVAWKGPVKVSAIGVSVHGIYDRPVPVHQHSDFDVRCRDCGVELRLVDYEDMRSEVLDAVDD